MRGETTVNKPEYLAMAKGIAKDMGIPVARLLRDAGMMKVMRLENVELREDVKDVERRADNVAEKFGTFNSDKAANTWARISRDSMRNDKAAIAARKIIRAIPRDKAALVTTARGYEVVTIHRVERAANVDAIKRQLAKAVEIEKAAMAARESAESDEARKTNLNRAPKAAVSRSKRRSAVADTAHARVRFLRRKLARATSQKVARNLTYERVGDVRLSLRPQSMANQVARLSANIPARKDIHPFREVPHIRQVTETTSISAIHKPEYSLMVREEWREYEQRRAARELRRKLQREQIAREDAERAEIERAERLAIRRELHKEESEKRRVENNVRRAAAAKIRRENAKLHKLRKMK
jgi:hypothetical protein